MSDAKRREERAFDALIVSQLRRNRDILNSEDLLPLDESDVAALNSIPDNLIDALWSEECSETNTDCEEIIDEERQGKLAFAGAGDCNSFGMDRAINMNEDDRDMLDQSREDAREAIRKRILNDKEKRNG